MPPDVWVSEVRCSVALVLPEGRFDWSLAGGGRRLGRMGAGFKPSDVRLGFITRSISTEKQQR